MIKRIPALVALFVLIALLAGCASQDFLSDVSVRPLVISPNADGSDDIAEIKYSLSRQSNVSIWVVDADGARHAFRDNKRRSKGDRTAYFSGVIDDRLLPDGEYLLLLEAVDGRGRVSTAEHPITLSGGDPIPLEINNLSVWPNAFTPDRDGITDRVTIGYNLSKEAMLVSVYLKDAEGNKYLVPEDQIREMGAPGAHEHDYDAGIDLGAAPPPDGDYVVVVEAQDAIGNRTKAYGSLRIEEGGVPQVEVVNRAAVFSPSVVPLGSTLTFTCTVKNTGLVPVRTKGPESGFTYGSTENYNTIGAYEEPGTFRIGLDYEGNSSGRQYPFRWQLGTDAELTVKDSASGPLSYLMPGQTVTVVGHLRIDEKLYKVRPYFWLGLIHEQVEIVQDQIDPVPVAIGF